MDIWKLKLKIQCKLESPKKEILRHKPNKIYTELINGETYSVHGLEDSR